MKSEFAIRLRHETAGFLNLTDAQVETLQSHWVLMNQWNRRLNLTAIRDPIEAIRKHYAESLFLATCLADVPHGSIVDIGSGAGFPGVPVAVMHSDSSVLLVESHARKAVFLREATRSSRNVSVLAGRAEALTGAFDVAASRAVAWSDLRHVVLRVARSVALLVGDGDVPQILGDPDLAWLAPKPLPWSGAGSVLIGRSIEIA